jgi:hypothetical protein
MTNDSVSQEQAEPRKCVIPGLAGGIGVAHDFTRTSEIEAASLGEQLLR